MADPKIVVIGGGTGTYTALMGLKKYSRSITAIVTMADDGGSSGRLRDEFGQLPPGDVRRALIALSDDQHMMLRSLFEYRFNKGLGLNGHSFGNLFLTALGEINGGMEQAIQEASHILNIRGKVLPVTTEDARLFAELEDGTIIHGEHNIDVRKVKPDIRIKRVFLSPEPRLTPAAREAIKEADILVLGPGDLYTSLIPNLLVQGMPEAIAACKGTRVFVCNLMTKHGETDGFGLSDFISEMERYLANTDSVDRVIANNRRFTPEVLAKYAEENAYPVTVDTEGIPGLKPEIVLGDLVSNGQLVRHDSEKLAKLIIATHESNRPAPVGTQETTVIEGNMDSAQSGQSPDETEPVVTPASRRDGMSNIYVLGSGYVGLVTGACFAELGHQVTCVDIDESKVERLNNGIIPIYEPDLEPLVKSNIEADRLRFTTSLDGLAGNADFVFMCVGTPAQDDGHVDLRYLQTAYTSIGQKLNDRKTVIVNKSSVPPGTTDKMAAMLNGLLNGHGPAHVVANPEFLREGHAVSDFMRPNRVVVGSSNEDDARAVAELYEPLKCRVMYTDASTAEMIKFASNAFLATKLTFINELANLCEHVGVNVRDVARGIGMDPRIGADYLRAGLGYGGSCLPKDTAILSSQFKIAGIEAKLLDRVIEVNDSQARRLVERVETALGTLDGVKIGVLGLAFKSDTDDTRHSPAIRVIQELQGRGADVTYYDPEATHTAAMFTKPVTKADSVGGAVEGAEAVFIATEWQEFKELDLGWLSNRMTGRVLADGRNLFRAPAVNAAGLTYIGVGTKESVPSREPVTGSKSGS
jgi:UDPglucose 6-dehydrogenase